MHTHADKKSQYTSSSISSRNRQHQSHRRAFAGYLLSSIFRRPEGDGAISRAHEQSLLCEGELNEERKKRTVINSVLSHSINNSTTGRPKEGGGGGGGSGGKKSTIKFVYYSRFTDADRGRASACGGSTAMRVFSYSCD